jgi:hypothetical protein
MGGGIRGARCTWLAETYIAFMAFENLILNASSSIAAAAYDSDERTLRITFRPAAVDDFSRSYDYLRVPPEVVEDFLSAESHGQFVNGRIKPNYEWREVAGRPR